MIGNRRTRRPLRAYADEARFSVARRGGRSGRLLASRRRRSKSGCGTGRPRLGGRLRSASPSSGELAEALRKPDQAEHG